MAGGRADAAPPNTRSDLRPQRASRPAGGVERRSLAGSALPARPPAWVAGVKQITESQMPNTTSHTRSSAIATRARAAAETEPLAGARLLLLAPDDLDLAGTVEQLIADDIDVVTAHNPEVALARLHGVKPNALIVASDLGEAGSGYAALEDLRHGLAIWDDTPAIAICARAQPLDRLRALQRGCVDVLALPVFYPELVIRLQLAMSRGRARALALSVDDGRLVVELTAQIATFAGQQLHLSRKEFELLVALAREPARLHSKEELLRDVWGYRAITKTRTLDSHACRLRRKLRDAGAPYLHNVWGRGYRLI